MSSTQGVVFAHSVVRCYRQVLATHRAYLPLDMRLVGDMYARDEFRTIYEKASSLQEQQQSAFLSEWSSYCETLKASYAPQVQGLRDSNRTAASENQTLPSTESIAHLDASMFTDEQKDTLRKLRRETKEYVEAINERMDGNKPPVDNQ